MTVNFWPRVNALSPVHHDTACKSENCLQALSWVVSYAMFFILISIIHYLSYFARHGPEEPRLTPLVCGKHVRIWQVSRPKVKLSLPRHGTARWYISQAQHAAIFSSSAFSSGLYHLAPHVMVTTTLCRLLFCADESKHQQAPGSSPSVSSQGSNPRELVDEVPWRRVNEVAPGLFVGGLESARSLRFLLENGVNAVLSLSGDFVPAQDRTLGMWHARVALEDDDTTDMLVELPRAIAFVAQALAQGRRVLVHSVRGQNRAPAVVAAYRKQRQSSVARAR
jgi:hypothetical protein